MRRHHTHSDLRFEVSKQPLTVGVLQAHVHCDVVMASIGSWVQHFNTTGHVSLDNHPANALCHAAGHQPYRAV